MQDHQTHILYKLAPVDIAINLVAMALLIALYFDVLPLNDIQTLLSFTAIICTIRLVMLGIARLLNKREDSDNSKNMALVVLWLSALVAGIYWGTLPLAVHHYGYSSEISPSVIALIISALTISALAGSGLKNSLWLAFTLPAISLPLGNAIWLNNQMEIGVWGLLFSVAFLVTRANAGSDGMGGHIKHMSLQTIELKTQLGEAQKNLGQYKHKLTELNNAVLTNEEKLADTEERLGLAQQELKLFMNNADSVFFRSDKDGYLIYISTQISDLVNIAPTDLIGSELKHLFASTDIYYAFIEAIDNQLGVVQDYRTTLKHRFDHEVWVSISAQYIQTGLNPRDGMMGIIKLTKQHNTLSDVI